MVRVTYETADGVDTESGYYAGVDEQGEFVVVLAENAKRTFKTRIPKHRVVKVEGAIDDE